MKNRSSNTLRQLVLLLFIFTIGLISLIFLHIFFLNLQENLDKKIENLQAKMKIGEFLVNDLYKIRSDFYELTTTVTNKRGRELIKNKIYKRIVEIKNLLRILNSGGTVNRVTRLNIPGHHDTVNIINYKKDKEDIVLEVIDLAPKLEEFNNMVNTLIKLLTEQSVNKKNSDFKSFFEQNRRIKRFYKSTPAFFIRITENANRLLYESSLSLKELEKKTQEQKAQYTILELVLIIVILILVIILGLIIGNQIILNTKKLERQERFVRGILDAQKNIVIVSNGEEMIDANRALIDFFDGFESFEDFSKDHICICDFFEDINNDEYVLDMDYDGLKWFEYIIANPTKNHKVAITKDEEINHFSISAEKKDLSNNDFVVIVVLNNITKEIKTLEELKRVNDNLEDIVDEKTQKLQELNETLEEKIIIEVEKNREKDKAMIQQSRFAAVGEMIGNIAHQWRQPLSAISSTVTSMQIQREIKVATDEDIDKSYNSILQYISFLNQTIEDFRGFFKKDKEIIEFNIIKIFENASSITSAVYKNYSILLIKDFKKDEYKTTGFPNELTQVFLNILNNAKDVLIEKKIPTKIVKVEIFQTKNFNVIKIIDNAGGINKSIKDKIFDPYFTTKHKSQGTGIGLYMSKDIIEKSMKGSLTAENCSFEYEGKSHNGACFIIELPRI